MKSIRTTAVAACLTAGLMVAAPAALAANTLQVGGVGTAGAVPFEMDSKTSVDFMTDFDVPYWCDEMDFDGYVSRGTTLTAGTKIGAITAMTASGCNMTDFVPPYPLIWEKRASPAEWGIYVTNTPATKNSLVNVEIRGVAAHWHSKGATPWACDAGVGLPTGVYVNATFNENTQELTINPYNFPLLIDAWNGSGIPGTTTATCGGQIQDGDVMSMDGVFTLDTLGAGNITNG